MHNSLSYDSIRTIERAPYGYRAILEAREASKRVQHDPLARALLTLAQHELNELRQRAAERIDCLTARYKQAIIDHDQGRPALPSSTADHRYGTTTMSSSDSSTLHLMPHERQLPKMGSMTSSEAEAPPALLEEYRQWRALGAGGIAFDWNGFMFCKNAAATIARNDTTSLALYDSPELYAKGWKEATEAQRKAAQTSFLKERLPEREGPRAKAKPFVFPQREKNEGEPMDEEVRQAYQTTFDNLSSTNSGLVWKTSILEKHGPALFLSDSLLPVTPLASYTKGEIAHIHLTDLSGHVTLSFADAREVIEKGWGERHKLSGTDWLHLGYTMVFVPRNLEEVEVYGKIYQAGIEFMKSGCKEGGGERSDSVTED